MPPSLRGFPDYTLLTTLPIFLISYTNYILFFESYCLIVLKSRVILTMVDLKFAVWTVEFLI